MSDYMGPFDEMDDEECNIPEYAELSADEIMERQKEFAMLNSEAKGMLRDIQGIQNCRFITLNALFENSVKVINESDDNIEDIEFSEEYLKFLNWYGYQISIGQFYNLYEIHETVFEDILNSNLENEDDNNIFAYFKKMYIEKVQGVKHGLDEPLSGVEQEAAKRFEKLSTTNVDLIKIFENIISYKGMKWDEFEKVLE